MQNNPRLASFGGIFRFGLACTTIWALELGFMRYAPATAHALGLPAAAGNLVWYLGFIALLVAIVTLTRSPAPWATWPKWQWSGLSLIDVSGIVTVVVVL